MRVEGQLHMNEVIGLIVDATIILLYWGTDGHLVHKKNKLITQ